MMVEHVEREWKLVVPDEDTLLALRELDVPAGLQGSRWRRTLLDNQYFDTAHGDLASIGGALRLRKTDDGRLILTLKYGHRRADALHRMTEVEVQVPGFDYEKPWSNPSPTPMVRLGELVGRVDLVPIARFDTERFHKRMEDARGVGATLVLDRFRLPDRKVALELELELDAQVDGAPWSRWIEDVRSRFGLCPSTQTKLARALNP